MAVKNIKLDGRSVPLREFDLKNMVENPSIVMIAKRGSGKSWVCRSILKYFKDIPGGVIISPTDRMSSFYGEFFPELFIHYEYSAELIESILYRQRNMIYKQKEKAKLGKKIDPRAVLVMDDCLSTKGTWANEQSFSELLFNGRHYKIMYILTMQFALGVRPELRSNFDCVFLLANDFYSDQKRIYDHYAGIFPTFKAFRDVFMEVTNDYGSMVIVNRGANKDFLDKVFWYKAINDPIDKMGSKQFNIFHEQNYNHDWNNPAIQKQFNAADYFSNKRNKFQVNKIGVNTTITKEKPF